MDGTSLALALLLVPLASALLTAVFFRRRPAVAAALSVGAAGVIVLLAGALIVGPGVNVTQEWLRIGPLEIKLGFLVDDVAKLMLFVVAVVGFLIHVFSLGYMKDDPNRARFFGCMSLFMFAMLGLTVADDLIMLFIFWELVGLASYLLIGFYLERPSAVAAAKKAFIVNRIGDFGFLIGIILAYWTFGSITLEEIGARLHEAPGLAATAIALLVFCGAVGKSGQFPLHVWLPDAMEGPTPVSALIHAATMVAAGIYLLCRVTVIMTPEALQVILAVGVVTALFAGFTALGQRDIKRILAYSTISQLGYMVAGFALGSLVAVERGGSAALAGLTGGVAAAMFHLTTHAFFKALLFLGSGSVIHACHHEQDIYRQGGLARKMPLTFATFTVGVLALVGAPFFAGFFSKDAILLLALEHSRPVFYLLVFGALLTALYMTRLWVVVFLGGPRSEAASHAHESGAIMTVPLVLLAVGAALAGYGFFYPAPLQPVIAAVPANDALHHTVVLFGTGAFALGLLFGFAFYRPAAADDRLERLAPPLYHLFERRFFIDAFYDWYVAKVQQRFAMVLNFLEQILLAGAIVRGLAGVAAGIGLAARALHRGSIHGYVYWFLLGAALFWAFAVGVF